MRERSAKSKRRNNPEILKQSKDFRSGSEESNNNIEPAIKLVELAIIKFDFMKRTNGM